MRIAANEGEFWHSLRHALGAAAIGLFTALLGCGAMPPPTRAAHLPPIPRGEARIWIYREYEPYQSVSRPYVRINGAVVGISEAEGAFYRDVLPGDYYVTVDSDGEDVNQWANVAVAAGQQVFIKIEALRYWECGGVGRGDYWCRDTFYTVLQLPQVGAAEVAGLPYTAGQ